MVRMRYVAQREVTRCAFSLVFENAAGMVVLAIGSTGESEWHLQPGTGEVEFETSGLLLAPGTYSVKPSISAEGSILDSDDLGIPMAVRPGSVPVAGVYRQPGAWSHRPGPVDADDVSIGARCAQPPLSPGSA